jgi:hypothetical protein
MAAHQQLLYHIVYRLSKRLDSGDACDRWLTPPAGILPGSALSGAHKRPKLTTVFPNGSNIETSSLRPEGETFPAGGVSHRIT